VNTAHRLQEIAQGGQILLSAATYEEVKDLVCVQALPAQTLPGKRTPLTIYELLSVV
jgi:class 3 adenylate cyclase